MHRFEYCTLAHWISVASKVRYQNCHVSEPTGRNVIPSCWENEVTAVCLKKKLFRNERSLGCLTRDKNRLLYDVAKLVAKRIYK